MRARPDKRALGALLAVFTGHHTVHGGDTGVPESRFILSHFLSDDSPKQTYVAVSRGFRRAPGKQEGRPTDVLLTYSRETVTRSRAIETPRLCQAEALIT